MFQRHNESMPITTLMCTVVALLLSSTFVAQPAESFKVCGDYCGPNWCADTVISEEQCVATGVWGSPSDGGCADSCCRIHDYCCGEGSDRPACNTAIVGCLQASRCYLSICGAAVWAAMKVVSGWCCGSACPTAHLSTMPNIHDALIGSNFCFARESNTAVGISRGGLEVVPGLPILQFASTSFTLLPPRTRSSTSHLVTTTAPRTYFIDNTTNEVILEESSTNLLPSNGGGGGGKVFAHSRRKQLMTWDSDLLEAVRAAPSLRMFAEAITTTSSTPNEGNVVKKSDIAFLSPNMVYLPQLNQLSVVTAEGEQKILIEC